MDERTETVELVNPTVEGYRQPRQYSRRDVSRAAFASPAALVAYAVPLAVVSVLSVIAIVAAIPADTVVYANNSLQFVDVNVGRVLAVMVPLVLLAIAAHAFASAAAQLLITAHLISRPLSVVQAWRRSVQLLPRLLPVAALLTFVVGVECALAFIAVLVGLPAWLGIALLVVLLALSYPLVYIFSIAVLRPLPARSAWHEMRAVGRTLKAVGRLARIPVAIPLALGVGVGAALRFAETYTAATLIATTAFGIATTAASIVAIVAAIAVVSRLTLEGLSRQDAPQTIQLPAEATAPGRTPLKWAAAIVALALPWSMIAASIALNPTNISTTSVGEMGDLAPNAKTVDIGSGTLITRSEEYSVVSLATCDQGRCTPAVRVDWYGYGKAMAPQRNGGALTARWVVEDPKDGKETWTLEVARVSAAELQAGVGTRSRDSFDPDPVVIDSVTVVDFGGDQFDAERDIDLAIDNSGDAPVIASLSSLGSEHGAESVVSVYRCVDAECSSATKQSMPVRSDHASLNASGIDLAVGDDGTAFVALSEYQTGDSSDQDDTGLIVIPVTGEPSITTVIDGPEFEHGSTRDDWGGSQLVLTGDGNPAVLYRLKFAGTFQLLLCADQRCTTSTTEQVPGLTSADFFPALTVDDTGRPLIATYSANEKSVLVVSCTDALCTDFETRVVAAASQYALSALAIEVDSRGLPIVTIADNLIRDDDVTLGDPARVVLCEQARCGAK
jgi:hypothetical protein